MQCSNCKKWIVERATEYADGSRIANFTAPSGKGHCGHLNFDTPADFGCNQFEEGHEHVLITGKKSGSPWHHYIFGECPDCHATTWSCHRCAGTGKVRYYDDGFIGENQTAKHPNEKQDGPPGLYCLSCKSPVDRDWLHCPRCGTRTNKSEEQIIQTDILGVVS